ncbi:cell division control protein [Canna indica]|uniref:Cell division control protein n=1 Tax=Canna indica TaxID=4628 RepID=A0AAQ3KIK8_9LILI|nr:cell division control protein [Canna indica]
MWLVLRSVIVGLAQAFKVNAATVEFFYNELPKSMNSFVMALWSLGLLERDSGWQPWKEEEREREILLKRNVLFIPTIGMSGIENEIKKALDALGRKPFVAASATVDDDDVEGDDGVKTRLPSADHSRRTPQHVDFEERRMLRAESENLRCRTLWQEVKARRKGRTGCRDGDGEVQIVTDGVDRGSSVETLMSIEKGSIGGDSVMVDVGREQGPRLHDLGGMKGVLEELMMEVIVPLCHPEQPRRLGVRPMARILLHGPPECGKTKLAHVIANETGVPFYKISATEVVRSLLVIDTLGTYDITMELTGKKVLSTSCSLI